MRRWALIAIAWLTLSGRLCADLASPTGVTLSVKAGDKGISADDLALTQKTGYVHILFNASPYPAADPAALPGILLALVKEAALPKFPKAAWFKIDVADVSARDDYGLPVWEKIKVLGRYSVKVGKKGLQIQSVPPKP